MPGFRNVRKLAVSVSTEGRTRTSTIRKTPVQASAAGAWVDLSMAPGIPYPNYYASEPYIGSVLSPWRGILHGDAVAPKSKHVHVVSLMPSAAGMTGTYMLLDYLLYYPFIDLDAVGETQVLDNGVAIPRYVDGEGVQAFLVAVAPTTGAGIFTFDYVNQLGQPRTSPVHTMAASAVSIASIVTALPGNVNSGYGPFLRLLGSDTGIRSVTSLTMSAAGGGLGALVLCRPLMAFQLFEAGTPTECVLIQDSKILPRVYDGAYLNMICQTPSSVAGVTVLGRMEFAFSED